MDKVRPDLILASAVVNRQFTLASEALRRLATLFEDGMSMLLLPRKTRARESRRPSSRRLVLDRRLARADEIDDTSESDADDVRQAVVPQDDLPRNLLSARTSAREERGDRAVPSQSTAHGVNSTSIRIVSTFRPSSVIAFFASSVARNA